MPKSSPAQIAITLEMLSARAKLDWPKQADNHRAELSRKALNEARAIHRHLAAFTEAADSRTLPLEFLELVTALGFKLTEMATAMEQEDQTMRLIARRLFGSESQDSQLKGGIAELLGEVTENLSCTGMLNPEHIDSVRQLDEQFRKDRKTARERPMLAFANLVPRLTEVIRLAREGNQLVSDALTQSQPADLFATAADEVTAADDMDLGSEEDWFGQAPDSPKGAAAPEPAAATQSEDIVEVDVSEFDAPASRPKNGTADFEIVTDLPLDGPPRDQQKPLCYAIAGGVPDIIDFPECEDDFLDRVRLNRRD